MAGDVQIETTDPNKNAMDYKEHEGTYVMFLELSKVVIGWCLVVLIALLLVNAGWGILAALVVLFGTIVAIGFAAVLAKNAYKS